MKELDIPEMPPKWEVSDYNLSAEKRAFSLAFATATAGPAAVAGALTAIAIKIEDGGHVITRPQRVSGGDAKPFPMLKFRSLQLGRENESGTVGPGDDRTTKVGRRIRVGIDELPQLIHVFRGEMDAVGPRPLSESHINDIMTDESLDGGLAFDWYQARGELKPGMFGPSVLVARRDIVDENVMRAELNQIENGTLADDWNIVRAVGKHTVGLVYEQFEKTYERFVA